jgi:four helix bundle protein
MGSQVGSYRDLVVWQEAMTLAELVYRLVELLPSSERFELSSQLRRAAVSVPSNVAEGYARGPSASYAQFLKIARGSLREIETQLLLASRLKLVGEAQTAPPLEQCDKVARLLHGLLRSVEKTT